MTENETKLDAVLQELVKGRAMQRGAWQRVTDIGRQYAQMKAHGSYLEDGRVISISHSSRDSMTDMFKSNLLRAVESAYAEDALMGATLAAHT